MKLTRRAVIEDLLIATAASGLPLGVAFAAHTDRPAACVVDRQLTGSAAMLARFNELRTAVHQFSGDPGSLWMHTLEPALRSHPVAIAGYTSAPTLFCLQYLARDYGLALTAHTQGAASLDSITANRSNLLDLRDPEFTNQHAAFTWLLAPKRG